MINEQERRRRRLTYRLVQLVLVMASVGIVVAFVASKRSERTDRGPDVRIRTDAPVVALLAAGDAQLFNVDTTVELVLRGDKMLAGLSPKVVCLLYTSPSPRDRQKSRMPSSA